MKKEGLKSDYRLLLQRKQGAAERQPKEPQMKAVLISQRAVSGGGTPPELTGRASVGRITRKLRGVPLHLRLLDCVFHTA